MMSGSILTILYLLLVKLYAKFLMHPFLIGLMGLQDTWEKKILLTLSISDFWQRKCHSFFFLPPSAFSLKFGLKNTQIRLRKNGVKMCHSWHVRKIAKPDKALDYLSCEEKGPKKECKKPCWKEKKALPIASHVILSIFHTQSRTWLCSSQ